MNKKISATVTKVPVSFPDGHSVCWAATINHFDRMIEKGHCLPWTPRPTQAVKTPFGCEPAGVGLFSTKTNQQILQCADSASAEAWLRKVYELFGYEESPDDKLG